MSTHSGQVNSRGNLFLEHPEMDEDRLLPKEALDRLLAKHDIERPS